MCLQTLSNSRNMEKHLCISYVGVDSNASTWQDQNCSQMKFTGSETELRSWTMIQLQEAESDISNSFLRVSESFVSVMGSRDNWIGGWSRYLIGELSKLVQLELDSSSTLCDH